MPRKAVEREGKHDARRARWPALDRFETLQKAANVEQKTGEFRPDGIERARYALLGCNHQIGEGGCTFGARTMRASTRPTPFGASMGFAFCNLRFGIVIFHS
jgi:hypothetical protein